MSRKYEKFDALAMAVFPATKPGPFNWLEKHSRPFGNVACENTSDQPIVIEPGEKFYMPGLFLNKWQVQEPTVDDQFITIRIPVGLTHPLLKNGVKTKQ